MPPSSETLNHFRPAVAGMRIGVSAKGFLPAECRLEDPGLTADVTLDALAQLTVYGGRIGLEKLVLGFQGKERPLRLPGSVSFPNLPPGEYELTIVAPPRLPLAKHRFSLAVGEKARIDLGSLELGVRVTGRTVDEAGRPVPRVLVNAPTEGLPTGYELAECQVTSDADGEFEMRLVPGLNYRF